MRDRRAFAAIVPFFLSLQLCAERWAIKTLKDQECRSVDFTPRLTTVRELVALPVPSGIYGPPGRIHRMVPTETTVWRVRARLVLVELERDGDLHLVLAEFGDPTITMIAEIPDPSENARFAGLWQAARRAALAATIGARVEIEGVGFFDFVHAQIGVAPNGIELHPVTHFKVIP
jgi:hypothetical protein